MQKAFSVVEFSFMILILSILASVAVSKFSAIKDDAEVIKAASDLSTAVTDIATYYIVNGEFNDNLHAMTEAVDENGHIFANKNISCVSISVPDKNAREFNVSIDDKNALCLALKDSKKIKNLCKDNVANCKIKIEDLQVAW